MTKRLIKGMDTARVVLEITEHASIW